MCSDRYVYARVELRMNHELKRGRLEVLRKRGGQGKEGRVSLAC